MKLAYRYKNIHQHTEQSVTREEEHFVWRYAYARALETQHAQEKGQDYLTFARNEQSFLFALCDGVSLSYCGELAAKMLGDGLLDWLASDLFEKEEREEFLLQQLDIHLQSLTTVTSRIIDNHPIPSSITGLLRDVLESKRTHGSEAMYICGRIDLPSHSFPNGRILFAWQGDLRLRLFNQELEITECLQGTFTTQERWSTLHGPVGGKPHLFQSSLAGQHRFTRMIAYTDGLATLDKCYPLPTDNELQSMILQAGDSPLSDDIALMDVSWNQTDSFIPYDKAGHKREWFAWLTR
ncbi:MULTISPECIES: hypothetical protein [Brevibacillus]|uniref:hypothetical protein n=1 Tax=Brevibacillus TaxID=55080 RepID=UPI000240315E|nr:MULTISPECIES: hypothetical protein [Brevibacillus]MBA4532118.1 hypothetical protein [Brevibacillus halotolerans]CCF13426.1 putative uncharacterized protein [Brevibacillus laterosporus GI-9]